MAGWESAICPVNGINIHYTRTGGDKPPVILLHGLMTSGVSCWTGLARTLESEYDLIMPDARGHGRSSAPDFGYRYDDHANDVVGLIDALKITVPILLGHSMGGMTAALVASRKPNLLRGLVLVDPTFLSAKVQRQVCASNVADQHRQKLNMSLEQLVAEGQTRHPDRPLEIIELFAKARLQTSMAAFDVLTWPNPNYKTLMREINIPSLIVFGDKGVVSAAVAKELHQLNPMLQTAQISKAGHSVHLDQAQRFTAVVRAFLRAI